MLAVGAALTIGISAIVITTDRSYAVSCPVSTFDQGGQCPGQLIAKFGGGVVPKALPRQERAPVAVKLWGSFSTDTGEHPSALREAAIYFDRAVALNAEGLAVCHPFARESGSGDLRRVCASAIVGSGRADFEIALPEEASIPVSGNLTVFNGGVKGAITTLYAVAFVKVPVPNAIVIPVKIERIDKGRVGLRAVAKLPRIAAGSGSLLRFSLKVKRRFGDKDAQESYLTARCPDGHLEVASTFLFKNEAKRSGVAPNTTFRGSVAVPCRSKD